MLTPFKSTSKFSRGQFLANSLFCDKIIVIKNILIMSFIDSLYLYSYLICNLFKDKIYQNIFFFQFVLAMNLILLYHQSLCKVSYEACLFIKF